MCSEIRALQTIAELSDRLYLLTREGGFYSLDDNHLLSQQIEATRSSPLAVAQFASLGLNGFLLVQQPL